MWREQEEMDALRRQVEARFHQSAFAKTDGKTEFINVCAFSVMELLECESPFFEKLVRHVTTELADGSCLFVRPAMRPIDAMSIDEAVACRAEFRRLLHVYDDDKNALDVLHWLILSVCHGVLALLPRTVLEQEGAGSMAVSVADLIDDLPTQVDAVRGTAWNEDVLKSKIVEPMCARLEQNMFHVSGISEHEWDGNHKKLKSPQDQKGMSHHELVRAYLGGTPFTALFDAQVPFSIPTASRFEHCHVLGGSGMFLANADTALQSL